MATSDSRLRRAPLRPKPQRVPAWAIVVLAALAALLAYGMMQPKTPSAFDRPEAQVNPPVAPWTQPHAF